MTDNIADINVLNANEGKADPHIMNVYESFKDANDERIIADKKGGDVLLDEKVERINDELDRFIRMQRPILDGQGRKANFVTLEHKAAFNSYVRSGREEALRSLEAKSMNGMLAPDNGYLLPLDSEQNVLRRMAAFSPMRAISSVRQLNGYIMKRAVYPSGSNSGWTAQVTPSNTVTSNQYSELNFSTMELFAQPAATQTMLDDSAIDIESWISNEIEFAFASAESSAFIVGDGVNRPKGLLSYPTVADSSWSWGNIGVSSTGVSGGFPTSNPSDAIVDFAHSLKSVYRQNATFLMNRKTQGAIRKFKDSMGNYIWAPPTVIGAKATLMNFPVVEAEDMPDISANSLSIAFGDFMRGYLILDRMGIRTLRDPYSAKPYVLFYTTKRVGGGIQDFAAIKLLKFGT